MTGAGVVGRRRRSRRARSAPSDVGARICTGRAPAASTISYSSRSPSGSRGRQVDVDGLAGDHRRGRVAGGRRAVGRARARASRVGLGLAAVAVGDDRASRSSPPGAAGDHDVAVAGRDHAAPSRAVRRRPSTSFAVGSSLDARVGDAGAEARRLAVVDARVGDRRRGVGDRHLGRRRGRLRPLGVGHQHARRSRCPRPGSVAFGWRARRRRCRCRRRRGPTRTPAIAASSAPGLERARVERDLRALGAASAPATSAAGLAAPRASARGRARRRGAAARPGCSKLRLPGARRRRSSSRPCRPGGSSRCRSRRSRSRRRGPCWSPRRSTRRSATRSGRRCSRRTVPLVRLRCVLGLEVARR